MPSEGDTVHALDRWTMEHHCTHPYCKDMVNFLFPALDRAKDHSFIDGGGPPILYQFGDAECTRARLCVAADDHSGGGNSTGGNMGRYPSFPVYKKFRRAMTRQELDAWTDETHRSDACGVSETDGINGETPSTTVAATATTIFRQPIVVKLKAQRHYGRIYQVAQADVAWENKMNVAVFRGELTGQYPSRYRSNNNNNTRLAALSDVEKCQLLPRCALVYHYARSTPTSSLVDAKLSLPYPPNWASNKGVPRYLPKDNDDDGALVDLYGDILSLEELLQFKALIMMEGNDVSSGLKWALFSNSVVLMPPPTFTSWAMEELLEPWVHYIPINATDVEDKMQWIVDNDDAARRIAVAGKLWIADLVLHPDVSADEEAILDEIVLRYQAHFYAADQDVDVRTTSSSARMARRRVHDDTCLTKIKS
jgi:hypothetical protein